VMRLFCPVITIASPGLPSTVAFVSTTTVTELDELFKFSPAVLPVQVIVVLMLGLGTVPLPEVIVQLAHAVPGAANSQIAVPPNAANLKCFFGFDFVVFENI
jgi:hypothetical protein